MDARYKIVTIENGIRPFPSQGTPGTARLWTLRSKFNAILEMAADSDIHLSKSDAVLERFAEETSNEYKATSGHYQSSQSKTNIGSSRSVVVLRDGEELIICVQLVMYQPRGGLDLHPGLSLVLKILYHRRK